MSCARLALSFTAFYSKRTSENSTQAINTIFTLVLYTEEWTRTRSLLPSHPLFARDLFGTRRRIACRALVQPHVRARTQKSLCVHRIEEPHVDGKHHPHWAVHVVDDGLGPVSVELSDLHPLHRQARPVAVLAPVHAHVTDAEAVVCGVLHGRCLFGAYDHNNDCLNTTFAGAGSV